MMVRLVAIACIFGVSCSDAADQRAKPAPAPSARAMDAAPAKPWVPSTPKLSAAKRLANELEAYRLRRQTQRAAVRGIKVGRPLARSARGKRAYKTFVQMHTDTKLSIAELQRMIDAELSQAEAAIALHLGRGVDRRSVNEPRQPASIARAAQRRAVSAARTAFTKPPKAQRIRIIRKRRSPLAFYTRRSVYLNLHPRNRPPAHLVEAIIFHETIPGHHLETIANAGRHRDGDSNSRYAPFNGFVEGWGLYAEQLAADLGLYSNDLARLGRLELRAWRAARAAADLGLHHAGWTLAQARKFMTEHTVLSPGTIAVELDRVLHRPGRVLAYVVGAKTILRLRQRARRELGPLFSLPAFHDVVLGSGRIPLPTLERQVRAWIARIRKNQTA